MWSTSDQTCQDLLTEGLVRRVGLLSEGDVPPQATDRPIGKTPCGTVRTGSQRVARAAGPVRALCGMLERQAVFCFSVTRSDAPVLLPPFLGEVIRDRVLRTIALRADARGVDSEP
jgi:hypothetical protein